MTLSPSENGSIPNQLRLGSRSSDLALWQSRHVRDLLQGAWPDLQISIDTLSTKGDQILDTPLPLLGGKGLFTAELEAALHNKAIDAAVHSLKDLPTESPAGLTVGAVPLRANPADVLISRNGYVLRSLPSGAAVGTSSWRRAAQLKYLRPDLTMAHIRGNVPTRIRKALEPDGPYDAIILAYAGLERLGRLDVVSQVFPLEHMLPAPGQGALAVQCRDEASTLAIFAPLDHDETHVSVIAERGFLSGLGGGCSLPIAAYATVQEGQLTLHGRVSALDGSRQIDVHGSAKPGSASPENALLLGAELAEQALAQGAAAFLEGVS